MQCTSYSCKNFKRLPGLPHSGKIQFPNILNFACVLFLFCLPQKFTSDHHYHRSTYPQWLHLHSPPKSKPSSGAWGNNLTHLLGCPSTHQMENCYKSKSSLQKPATTKVGPSTLKKYNNFPKIYCVFSSEYFCRTS